MAERFIDRPLPTLAQWLGDGLRADMFEEWVADNLRLQAALDDPNEAMAVRLIQTLSIACVESLRIETERHDSHVIRAAMMLARVAGLTVFAANQCALNDDRNPPYLKIAKTLAEEFEHGAKMAARSAIKARASRDA